MTKKLLLRPRPAGRPPMEMEIGHSQLGELINRQLQSQGNHPVPLDCEISFKVPSGGDYSGELVELDNEERVLHLKWKT